ncbi:MAG: PspA/IM30 family protein [Fimbriimonadaceae bacterium]
MKRFFRWLRAIFHRAMDKVEDPDIMLDQAKREMQEALVANREKAVQAITQKNRLQGLLDDAEKRSKTLENQAVMALRQGQRDTAKLFLREKASIDSSIESLKTSLAQAIQTVEQVKIAIKRQEEEVRKKTAEALAMKAQWKQAQIQNSITKALEGLTFENQFEAFGAAKERIMEAQSEAAARQEMYAGSVQGKIMAMEDTAMDYQAEEDLRKLEEQLGMRPASATTEESATLTVNQANVSVSEIDDQIAELERRLNNPQS